MSNLAVIEQDIYGAKDSFVSVLTDQSLNFEREAGFAMQAIQASDFALKMAINNRQSVINAVTNIAAIGISLNPAKKQAYLVPRDKKICLDISYMGLMDLAMSTGSIRWAQAELVYQNDTFALNGMDKPPTHSFNPFSKDRGEVVGVYVVVKTSDGDYLTETMSADEVNAVRNRSTAKNNGPWVTDTGEMWKKTCVKRAYKYWPKTERLDQAIHYLNTDGEQGIQMDSQPQHDPELGKRWIDKVNNAQSTDAVAQIWQSGLADIKKAKDMSAYADFKAAVEKRGKELKAAEASTYEGEASENH